VNYAAIVAAIIAAVVALLAGMAGLIKSMVLGRLDEIQTTMSGLARELHRMDIRLTKLEAEHNVHICRMRSEVTE